MTTRKMFLFNHNGRLAAFVGCCDLFDQLSGIRSMKEPALSNLSDGKATWCGSLCLVSQRSVLEVFGQECILQVQLLRREALLEVGGRCIALPWFAGAELSRPCKMSSDYHSTWRQALHSISLDYFPWAKKQFEQDRVFLLSSGMSDSFVTIPTQRLLS